MRLEPLSIFHWSYEEDARVEAPGYAIVSAYDSEEGIGYGEGRGTATGQIEGTVVWSNYPRRRTDGRMLPNVRGLVTTRDGASILFELRGRTIFEGDEPGRQNLVGWFESDHKSYRWLNDVVMPAALMVPSAIVSTSCRPRQGQGAGGTGPKHSYTRAVPEAPLDDSGSGLAPAGDGWFVVNVREPRG